MIASVSAAPSSLLLAPRETVGPSPADVMLTGPSLFTVDRSVAGWVSFALSDGYSFAVDAAQARVRVASTASTVAEVAGGTMLSLSENAVGRFVGTTSLALPNGAMITMESASIAALVDSYRLDRVTVTEAERALVLTGFADPPLIDFASISPASAPVAPMLEPVITPPTATLMTAEQSLQGGTIEDDTRDGLTLVLDPQGRWSDELGETVTATTLAQTEVSGDFGPGSTMLSHAEFGRLLGRFVVSSFVWSVSASAAFRLSEVRHSDHDVAARDASIRRAIILYELLRAERGSKPR